MLITICCYSCHRSSNEEPNLRAEPEAVGVLKKDSHGGQNSPKAIHIMVFGPKSLFLYEPLEPLGRPVRVLEKVRV